MEVVGRRVEGLRAVTAIFVGSRIGLVLIALVALRYFPLNTYNRDHNSAYAIPRPEGEKLREPPVAADQAPPPVSSHAEPSWIAVWARWDALWYVRIAERGYAGRFGVDDLEGRTGEPPATGFFPLMPLLMRGVGWVVGSPLRAGLLISNVSLLVSLWLLFRMTRRLLGDEAAAIAGALLAVVSAGVLSLGAVLGRSGPRAFAGRAGARAGRPLRSRRGARIPLGADPADGRAARSGALASVVAAAPPGSEIGVGCGAPSPGSCRCSACSPSWATAARRSATRSLRFTGRRPGVERWAGHPPSFRSSAAGRGRCWRRAAPSWS